jgi:hypothetical protein
LSVKNFETFGLFERAAKAVEALSANGGGAPPEVDRLIKTCALAVRGESILWAEQNGASSDFEHYYNSGAPVFPDPEKLREKIASIIHDKICGCSNFANDRSGYVAIAGDILNVLRLGE